MLSSKHLNSVLLSSSFRRVSRILTVFVLANYFHLIDETRLTVNYMISSILYDETLSFPMELLCVELVYLLASIAFEVRHSQRRKSERERDRVFLELLFGEVWRHTWQTSLSTTCSQM